jgi:hypothetical protein
MAYRQAFLFWRRLSLRLFISIGSRKGRAFPHSTAAKPRKNAGKMRRFQAEPQKPGHLPCPVLVSSSKITKK